jgi:hypothetical protein
MGIQHASKIENSKDLQRLLELFKRADHPLSAEELTVLGYDYEKSGRLMLNVSEKIGEMRAPINSDRGYNISFSTRWKAAAADQEPARRENKDRSVTYIVPANTRPWHDSRPRYWLIAAPGWRPRWVINEQGAQIWLRGEAGTNALNHTPLRHGDTENGPQEAQGYPCKNPGCGKPVPDERRAEMLMTCSDECAVAWRASIRPKFEVEKEPTLF